MSGLTAKIAALVLASSLAGTGCGAGARGRGAVEPDTGVQARVGALFPDLGRGEVRVDRYDGHLALVRGGRVYGSTGEDMPGQVVGTVAGLALHHGGPHLLRVGQVGFGTGTAVGAALAAGSRMVDVFETDQGLVRAGEALAGRTGLSYQDGRPLHPSLRIVGPEVVAAERLARYDVIVSPPATTALAGQGALVTVSRLEDLSALLGSGGLLVHHVPAYDLELETYRRLLRTFAQVFPNLIVVAAGPQSGDTFVVASEQAVRFRPSVLRALAATSSLEPFLDRAAIPRAMDLPARTLFASRDEVLAFAEAAQPCTTERPCSEVGVPPRPPVPPAEATEAEREAWQRALAEWRGRFERMDLLRHQMMGLDWAYGQVCPEGIYSAGCLLAEVGANSDGARALAELALGLMAAGRFVEARPTLESAIEIGAPETVVEASRVLELLLGEVPDLTRTLPPGTLVEAREAALLGACGQALGAAPPEAAASEGERIATAFVVARCRPEDPEAMTTVESLLDPLEHRPELGEAYPALLYLRARAAMIQGRYDRATWTMLAYLRSAASGRAPAAPAPE